MKEKDFLKLYIELYREKGERISSLKVARNRVDFIWEILIDTLLKEKKVGFKGIGKFELREIRPRNAVLPSKKEGEDNYTLERKLIPSKKLIKFIPGVNFKALFNQEGSENNE